MRTHDLSGFIGMTVFALMALSHQCAHAGSAAIHCDLENPRIRFAAGDLQKALGKKGHTVTLAPLGQAPSAEFNFVIAVKASTSLQPEGYAIEVAGRTYRALGQDDAGAMYGGLELAEVVAVDGLSDLKPHTQNPYMRRRGTKFNIPLDARTPSYTDLGDAGQKNIAEMWNMDFWTRYIDDLTRARYNFISLWNLHPFPSMVRVPEYPDVALADVKRSTCKWEEYSDTRGKGYDSDEILRDLETLKKMTIEEKMAFWREVMRYGKERNVAFDLVTWNTFVYGTGGKYGLTDSIENEKTVDYFRKSVKQLFLTYPDLEGIGLTTGENMKGSTAAKEKWAFATYGMGVLDAVREQPGRKILFIHRQHQAGVGDILKTFKPLIEHKDIEFIFSFKYAQAHVYSCTRQPFHDGFVKDISQEKVQTIWTLRNDDVYYFRWGAPDFVREFIQNIPRNVSQGYYYGSDGYIWGREFTSTEPDLPREIELDKHWYHWMLWGRLGYDPTVANGRFEAVLEARFPGVAARDLFAAWQEASMVYPIVTGFHWGALDFQWYIEGCRSHKRVAKNETGFHDVNNFIDLDPHKSCDYESIPEFVKKGKAEGARTPFEVADELRDHATKALTIVDQLDPKGNKELRLTLGDIRSVASMGMYYSHKIRGATCLALCRASKKKEDQDSAIQELNAAAHWWRVYASNALAQYENPMWMNRVGHMDWRKTMADVLEDIRIAGGKPQVESMSPTPGGTIVKPENQAGGACEFSVTVTEPGMYALEVAYTLAEGQQEASVTIDGSSARKLIFWSTGGPDVIGWDRIPCRLDAGAHRIRLKGELPEVKHLNLVPLDH